MGKVREMAKMAAATQVLIATEGGEELLVGGQAVIEGVMMRSPHSYCISVRKPDGRIAMRREAIQRPSERHKIFKWPVLRGLGTLGQALTLGVKSLKFSADIALEAEAEMEAAKAVAEGREVKTPSPDKKGEVSDWMMAVNMIFSVGFFIVFYKFLPLILTQGLQKWFPAVENHFVFNFVDGVIRILLFLAFLYLMSQWKDIRRVFEYHGAEHKTVFNFESGQDVNVANARKFVTLHPRCGTSFMLVIMVISMLVYTLVPYDGFWARMISRVVLLPVIAGVSYELIRFAARRQGSLWSSMVAPGLWLQRITTKEPSDEQLEIAIHALDRAMELEMERGGELVIA